MPVTVIPSEQELPPCGNCGETLKGGQPAILYIFDRFDEIGEEIKTGELNLAVCPVCKYHGWVWGGLLVIDRGRARGVFVTHLTNLPAQEKLLATRLEEAREFLEAGTFEAVGENVVRVEDYRHVYELLCQDDDLFRAEAANGSAFRSRSGIADPDERAAQFVEDVLRIGFMLLLREESSPEFVAAVLRALDRKRSQPDTPAEVAERCALMRRKLEAAARSLAPPEADDAAHLRTVWANAEEPTEEQRRQGMNIFGAHELVNALQQTVAAAREELVRAAGATGGPPGTAEFTAALRSLLTPAGAPSPDEIETLAESAAALAPEAFVSLGEETCTVAEAVRRGVRGRGELLCAASHVALAEAQQDKDAGFYPGLTHLLVRLQQRADADAHVARFLGFVLCGEFFSNAGMAVSAAGAYAAAALSFEPPDDGRAVRVPTAALEHLAIAWQRLGRLLDYLGNPEQALMCARYSVRHFEAISRPHGAVQSGLDALSFALQLPVSAESVSNARTLLAHIRRLEEESPGRFAKDEAICLSQLGETLLNYSAQRPKLLLVQYGPGDGTAGRAEERPAPPGAGQEAAAPGVVPDVSAELDFVRRDFEAAQASLSDVGGPDWPGYVLAARFAFADSPPFIARLEVKGVEWFDCFQEAAEIAARHRFRELWFHLHAQMIERSEELEQPGMLGPSELPFYFYQDMLLQAHAHGFGEPPEKVARTALLTLAAAFGGAPSEVKAQFFSRPGVARTMDRWRAELDAPSRAVSPIDGNTFKDTQGLIVGELFEVAERYEEARRIYLRGVRDVERHLLSVTDKGHAENLAGMRVTGLYRAARAGIKHYLRRPEPGDLRECLDMIECYKARSVLRRPLESLPAGGDAGGRAARVSSFYRLGFDELRGAVPPATALLVFALLPQSRWNAGFWFSVLVDTATDEVLHHRVLPFEDVYEPMTAANLALGELRGRVNGLSLDAACAEARLHEGRVNAALERLGDVLMPPAVVAEIERRKFERLMIVPEAYLFDAPLAALRVEGRAGRVHPFQLNEESGGLSVSVVPNWTLLAARDGGSEGISQGRRPLALTMAARPSWRRVPPLWLGITRRVHEALDAAGRRLGGAGAVEPAQAAAKGAGRVVDFLRMLRQSRVGVFFGHGEIDARLGSILIADDGPVGEYEVSAGRKVGSFVSELLILCACSGVNSQSEIALGRRDLAGAHVAMLRGGVQYIIGSVMPLFPVVAVQLLETVLAGVLDGQDFDVALHRTYTILSRHPKVSNPVFWGHIIGFGNGFRRLSGDEGHGN